MVEYGWFDWNIWTDINLFHWFVADAAAAQNIADRKATLKEVQEKLAVLESEVYLFSLLYSFRFLLRWLIRW